MDRFSVILAAAGQSTRFGDPAKKKVFARLADRPVWLHSAYQFRQRSDVQQVIIVVSQEDHPEFCESNSSLIEEFQLEVLIGGAERADSIENGLKGVDPGCRWVAIHDAARPCIDQKLIDAVFALAQRTGAAIPATPISSTVKKSNDGDIIETTIDRSGLFLAQTPQVFNRELIQDLYSKRDGTPVTDEAQLAEQFGISVALSPGSVWNRKITTPDDLIFAELYFEMRRMYREA